MKLIKAIAATACALALATAAQAETYTDSSENYEMGHGLATGDNGGTGFGAWVVESHGSGDGWAGCGIWDPSANNFQGDWAGKERAFGIIGKGDSYGINAYRPFRAPLAVGDSFSLEMGVNWDPNSGIDALKGFALLAKGGTFQALTINHRSNPGDIAINGKADSEILNAFGTYPMKWTFTAKDETTIHVTATPRDGSDQLYEEDWEVETSAIDGFRIQSSGQNPYEDEQAAQAQGETAQMWADRRQTYFDNFALEIAAELPDLTTLEFTSGEWAVSSATQSLPFSLKRSSTDGALDVTVSSSDESFVPATTVSFADGEEEVSFTLDATLTGSGNFAKLTASATGCDPATFEVKGPQYRLSVEQYQVMPETEVNFWMDWDDNGIRDDDKLTIEADPDGSLELPAEWEWSDRDGGAYVASSFKAVSSGTLILKYDGVQFADYGVTVLVPGFELSGPQTVKPGQTCTYTLKATLTEEELGCTVSFDPADAATADPDSFDLADPAEDGFYYQDIEVTFGDNPGDVTITVASDNYSADIDVTIKAPVDPSKFDDFIAYDDASLYDGEFDMNSLGAGSEGFSQWSEVKSSAQFGGVVIDSGDGGFPAILAEDGNAIALYANGENPDYSVLRPFADGEDGPVSLQPGQKASIEFIASKASGTRYIQFVRIWEGAPYNRFEIWNNGEDGNIGVNVEYHQEQITFNWAPGARRVIASVELAADSSNYTLHLVAYKEDGSFDDQWTYSFDNNWQDGIQGILVGGYDSGANFIFNKLAITQEEEPVKVRAIGFSEATWNPDVADVPYTFAIGATTTDIGKVALSVSPDDGGLTLSTDSLDLTDIDEATFTVTISADAIPAEGEGTQYTITATPADETVKPATYGVTPRAAYIYLTSDNWEYNDDQGAIWVTVHATPSHFGNYYVTVDPAEGILEIPELSQTITINAANQDACAFDLQVVGAGDVNVYIAHEGALDPSANYHFLIHESPDVEPVDLKEAVTFEKGSLKVKLPEGATIMTTTNLVTGPWVDFPAEVGEDGAVVIPTTGDGAFYRIGEPPATIVDDEGE